MQLYFLSLFNFKAAKIYFLKSKFVCGEIMFCLFWGIIFIFTKYFP